MHLEVSVESSPNKPFGDDLHRDGLPVVLCPQCDALDGPLDLVFPNPPGGLHVAVVQEQEEEESPRSLGKLPPDRGRAVDLLRRLSAALVRAPEATPTQAEYWMLMARAASSRSSSRRRSVGAALVSGGALVAIGANEVPAVGGGLEWPDVGTERRDLVLGSDIGSRRDAVLRDACVPLKSASQGLRQLIAVLDVERAVHAEVAAIADAAARGVSTQGAVMYTTHEPCYRCRRLLVAADVGRVVYGSRAVPSLTASLRDELESPVEVQRFHGLHWDAVHAAREWVCDAS